ncbi:MAG: hypothetical protein ABJP48_09375 [Erythrobacter sp.]
MSNSTYQKALTCYEEIVSEHSDLKVKGKANKYTSMNGNMFSGLHKDGTLTLRFSEAEKKAYNSKHGTGDVISYGAVMRGYVYVTPGIFQSNTELRALFARCVDHVRTLKPKPTKKT